MQSVLDHLLKNVLPAAAEYAEAEEQLSVAYDQDKAPAHWEAAAIRAKRRAANLAIAIDGLADRARNETGRPIGDIRRDVGRLCLWPGGSYFRADALERLRGVANAYKHQNLNDPSLPISSDQDVLALGVGYGQDGFGVGKYSGLEVFVTDKQGKSWKFLGDAPVSIAAWIQFLKASGVSFPSDPIRLWGLTLHP